MRWVVLVLLVPLLAGCAADEPAPVDDGLELPDENPELPMLSGVVFDAALRPVQSATVEVLETADSMEVDDEGGYAFEELPFDTPLLVVAKAAGYESATKQVTVREGQPIQVDFTLVPVPVITPYIDTFSYNGFMNCQAGVAVNEEGFTADCAGSEADTRVFDVNLNEDPQGLLIETVWTAVTPLAETMRVIVRPLDAGDQVEVLADLVGSSVHRVQIGEGPLQKHFDGGGRFRIEVQAYPDNDATEAGVGAALAVSQDFQVLVSVGYHEPLPPTYSLANP